MPGGLLSTLRWACQPPRLLGWREGTWGPNAAGTQQAVGRELELLKDEDPTQDPAQRPRSGGTRAHEVP